MSKVNTDPKKIDELLTRGVDEVIDKDHLEKKLKSGRVLQVKLGIDPTSPNIHLGRSIPLLKLRDFQELGHQIIFIVGDFTGVIGDTSDKDSERPMLSPGVIKKNMKDYEKQAGKIIDLGKCKVFTNSKWLSKLTYNEIGEQADQFSLAEFIARENIKRRLVAGKRVSLRELLYPLMQGYDSVEKRADVELGGTDQRFNLLAGKKLQKHYNQESQDIIMTVLMEGTDGRKMSSSWGNTINLTDAPNDMYGKIMSISDDLIIKYFTLATRVSIVEVNNYERELKSGANPRDIKASLAKEIVRMYHSEREAERAEREFIKKFKDRQLLEETPELISENANETLVEFLVRMGIISTKNKFIPSRTQFKKLIDAGAVKVNNNKIVSSFVKIRDLVIQENNIILKIGKFSDYILRVNLKTREVVEIYTTQYQDKTEIDKVKTASFNQGADIDNVSMRNDVDTSVTK